MTTLRVFVVAWLFAAQIGALLIGFIVGRHWEREASQPDPIAHLREGL